MKVMAVTEDCLGRFDSIKEAREWLKGCFFPTHGAVQTWGQIFKLEDWKDVENGVPYECWNLENGKMVKESSIFTSRYIMQMKE